MPRLATASVASAAARSAACQARAAGPPGRTLRGIDARWRVAAAASHASRRAAHPPRPAPGPCSRAARPAGSKSTEHPGRGDGAGRGQPPALRRDTKRQRQPDRAKRGGTRPARSTRANTPSCGSARNGGQARAAQHRRQQRGQHRAERHGPPHRFGPRAARERIGDVAAPPPRLPPTRNVMPDTRPAPPAWRAASPQHGLQRRSQPRPGATPAPGALRPQQAEPDQPGHGLRDQNRRAEPVAREQRVDVTGTRQRELVTHRRRAPSSTRNQGRAKAGGQAERDHASSAAAADAGRSRNKPKPRTATADQQGRHCELLDEQRQHRVQRSTTRRQQEQPADDVQAGAAVIKSPNNMPTIASSGPAANQAPSR